jgi:hypothetical protein
MSDPISNLKQELLAAAERQQARPAPSEDAQRSASARAIDGEDEQGSGALRRIGRRPGYIVLAVGALAAAAAAALFVTIPWNNPPGVLEKAQAALTPPGGTILHEKWEETSISTNPACTVKVGPNEIWIDQTPPYRYRLLIGNARAVAGVAAPRGLACPSETAGEFGGMLHRLWPLEFVPPNSLTTGRIRGVGFPLDPVTSLREAISAGRAHDEGETQLDGRTVERIRIDPDPPSACPYPGCPREPTYAYVDPETFYPVETHGPEIRGLGSRLFARLHIVKRMLTYEYLPRTAANLALTDIRAQHPNAVRRRGVFGP